MANKIMKCEICGNDVATSAKVCPNCGAKIKKPIYKRWWFIVLIIFIVLGAVFGGSSSDEPTANDSTSIETEQPKIEYTKHTVAEMVDELDANALSAEDKYDGQYVEITGKLNVIDSDGKYISLCPGRSEFELTGVQCYLMTDEHEDKVKTLSIGDTVTVKGKITSVGEVIGYSLDIDSIE